MQRRVSEIAKACCCLWVVDGDAWLMTTCPEALEAGASPLNSTDLKGPGGRPQAVTRARPPTSGQHGARVKCNDYGMGTVILVFVFIVALNNVALKTESNSVHLGSSFSNSNHVVFIFLIL